MSGTLTPGSPKVSDNGSVPVPTSLPPPNDQEQFDAAVQRNGKIFLRVIGGVAIFAAFLMSAIALIVSTGKSDTAPASVPAAVAAAPSPLINVSVAGESKRGPDGLMHDAFSKTDFAVKAGQPTRLRINNADSSPHSITAPGANVSITVAPGVHTYTLIAKTAGRFEWFCVIPCDSAAHGWAMTHPGYMAGYITAS